MMKIGFYQSCYMDWDLPQTFKWAKENGFHGIELHGGPRYKYLDWTKLANGSGCGPMIELQQKYEIPITGIMFGALPYLSSDPEERRRAADTVKLLLKAAANIGVKVVSTFTGRDPALSVEDNIPLIAPVFTDIAEYAERLNVKLAFENCPMYEFWPPVYNIAISPALWREIFDRVPSPALGLNIDPSHLIWQGIDIVQAVHDFKDKIVLSQAKDTELLPQVQRVEGMMTCKWWRHRIPGQGDVDWNKFVTALHDIGYDGILSIEHEDPVWSGTDAKVGKGLLLAKQHLELFV
ncbi:sugar phosphate isomerase/epimerase family protein [Paenibacillus piri]|uniref:Sugar phosphate isomerase/epimerase n=1 Tax=Paenibacillus piri TaxID=2547395 RepID=A0A4R5KSQ9_9BACL|nr:sugar phosphate isomerase/epimerase [Paenibacillus piri]TDF98055.1 sugar phosphate isomerase/epimerase [Paenibacillus piri]